MLSARHWYSLNESKSLLSNWKIGDITWVCRTRTVIYDPAICDQFFLCIVTKNQLIFNGYLITM